MASDPTPGSYVALLGGFPDTPALDPRVLGDEDRGEFRRLLVEYAATEETRVQAFVLVPKQLEAPVPGIVAIHQDGANRPYLVGKSEPAGLAGNPDLHYGMELCLRGYVVVCPDRDGFESRRMILSELPEAFQEFRIVKKDTGLELTEDLFRGCLANRALFQGAPLSLGLFEMHRAVDLLRSLPEVDPERIGAIGHSAGGYLATLLMYTNPRVKVGVSSCGTSLWRWVWGPGGTLRPINGFAGFVVPGLGAWGDQDDMLAGLAPRPYLETRGDPYPSDQTAELTRKARARYADLAVPERFEYVAYDGGHTFRRDMRQRSYAWLDRWLRMA